ncbi:hypothetical protein LguiA_023129 [Lonicera macranthoides]
MSPHHQNPIYLLLTLVHLLIFFPLSTQLRQQQISTVDLAALHQIKSTLTDIPSASSPFFSTWDFNSPDPCSTFSGVTCSARRLTSLTLGNGLSDSPGLSGFLTPFLSNLSELTQLILFPGIVTGPIPVQIGDLKKLRVISLTNNRLTGSIPDSIWNLPYLHTLDLSHNQLTGSVPACISGGLKVLVLASNALTGAMPELPPQLLHVDLKDNRLSGPLPEKMPSTIRYFSASGNEMWGPLNGMESLSELVYLDLSMNHFSGPIPNSLFRPSLSSMLLQRNNLSGVVPTHLSPSYGPGSIVDLSHNFLTGELPAALAVVESLYLNHNRLIGKVPEEYIESVWSGSTKTLYLQHNYLSSFPVDRDRALPESVALCLSYNCMVPPAVGVTDCPASSGARVSRPENQCSVFNKGSSSVG